MNDDHFTIIDLIAPVRFMKLKPSCLLRLNEDLRILKRHCIKTERNWNEDTLFLYQFKLKEERNPHL